MGKIKERLLTMKSVSITSQLPLGHLMILSFNVVFYSMAATTVFSFLPKLVKSFGVSDLSIGYYAGIVASSLFHGQLLFSMFWGYLADIIGKKRSAILTNIALMITTAMFGFSWNIYWAVGTRFLQGCSMGQIVVAKAILVDICSDSQMSLGISIVMTAFSTGVAIGPSIGGFLVFPDEAYPGVFSTSNIFSIYSVLLPNVVIAVGLGVGAVLTQFFINDDAARAEHVNITDENLPETDLLIESNSHSSYGTTSQFNSDRFEDFFILSTSSVLYVDSHSFVDVSRPKLFPRPLSRLISEVQRSKFMQLLKSKECLASSSLYGFFAMIGTGYVEIFPLLASTKPKYHGMGFTTSQIGVALISVMSVNMVLQMTLLPKLTNRYGAKKVIIGTCLSLALISPLFPSVALIRKPALLWCALLPVLFLLKFFISAGFLAVNIFVNNSVGPELLGSANGMAMSFASAGRIIGPLAAGSMFSWSLRNIKGVVGNENAFGFPLNQFFAFYVFSLCMVVIGVIVTKLPDAMNFKKIRSKCDGNDEDEAEVNTNDNNNNDNHNDNETTQYLER